MPSYRVTWQIDIENALNPEDAAARCLGIQRDHDSIATVFRVLDARTRVETVVDTLAIGPVRSGDFYEDDPTEWES